MTYTGGDIQQNIYIFYCSPYTAFASTYFLLIFPKPRNLQISNQERKFYRGSAYFEFIKIYAETEKFTFEIEAFIFTVALIYVSIFALFLKYGFLYL